MTLRIEDMSLQNVHLRVWIMKKIKVFDRLCEEEGLHSIIRLQICLSYILEVAVGDLCLAIAFDALENLPSPLAVDGVAGYLVQNKERLHSLRPKDVVRSTCRYLEVIASKVYILWRNSSFHASVHLIAGIGDGLGGGHVTLGSRRVESLWIRNCAKSQQSTHEANQMIHLSIKTTTVQIWMRSA